MAIKDRGACWKRRRRDTACRPGLRSSSSLVAKALLILVLVCLTGANALFGMTPKRFRYEGLIDAGSLGISDDELGQVAALGDWNGDSAIDVMTTSADGSKLRVHLWDHAAFKFQLTPVATMQVPARRKIVNVIPGDFNYDGRLDALLVMSTTGSNTGELEMQIHLGAADAGVEPNAIDLDSSSSDAQPLALDATGDMRTDLLGHITGSNDLKLWKNVMDTPNSTVPFNLEDAPMFKKDGTAAQACHLAGPHSSAFIDLDGDCLADIFLVCKARSGTQSYQIWTASKSSAKISYTLARQGSLPEGTGALSFADMDRDGTIDVVFPSCDTGGQGPCYINVAFNKQMSLCSEKRGDWFGVGPGSATRNDSSSACRDAESNLCIADPNFSFDFSIDSKNTQLARIRLSDVTPEDRLLMKDDLASSPTQLPLVLGDYDRDGYPDIAVITIPKSARRDETRLRLLNSVPCTRSTQGCPADQSIRKTRRSFKMMDAGTGAIDNMRDVRRATFFDIDEDGSLDLLLQRLPDANSGRSGPAQRVITFVQNNFFYDAFFLKAMTSNGACSSYCDPRKEGEAHYRPWGVNYGGASYKFTVLDPNGVRRAQQVGQLPQTAYQSLQLPYSYFGLGRTNNYVEALFVGITRRRENNFVEMEGVIPNSQVVILPWEPASSPDTKQDQGDSSTWRRELYLSPGEWIPWVTVVLVTIIIMLFGLVFVLHLHEKREDEKERKRAVHAINFDAL